MAKKKKSSGSSSNPNDLLQQQMSANQQMFQLDLDERKRNADMQNAQFIAEQMRLRMETEIRSRGYLVQPVRDGSGNWTGEFSPMLGANGQPVPSFDAAAQAREIALKEAEFELTKIRAERDYGLTYQDQQFRQAMESRQQQWTETYQRAQTMLAEGDLTGYYNGMATLDREKFETDASGYMSNGQATLARQKAEWDTILNAPRGPADYHAYMKRMRGIAGSGDMPGVLSQFVGGQGPIASVTGDMNSMPKPASNTELAMSLVYGNGQPQGYQRLGTPPGTTPGSQMQGGWEGGQPPGMLPGGGFIAPPGWTPPGNVVGGTPGTGSGSGTPFPWQSPPAGGWGSPTGGGTGGQMNPAALAQAIYGAGLQGVGHFNIDQMSQGDLDAWLGHLEQGGSSWDDPRIYKIMQAAAQAGYNTNSYAGWATRSPGGQWSQAGQPKPPPIPGQPAATPVPPTNPGPIDPNTGKAPQALYNGGFVPTDQGGSPTPSPAAPGNGGQGMQQPGGGGIFGSVFSDLGYSGTGGSMTPRGQAPGPWSNSGWGQTQQQQQSGFSPATSRMFQSIFGQPSGGSVSGWEPGKNYEADQFVPKGQQGSYNGGTRGPVVDYASRGMGYGTESARLPGGGSTVGPVIDYASRGTGGGMSGQYQTPGGGSTSGPYDTGSDGQQQPQYTGARNWSRQQFKKLSPTEQQYTLGWNAEENGETPEDAMYTMDRGAPGFRKSRLSQLAGIR